jgi:hypothetical protein
MMTAELKRCICGEKGKLFNNIVDMKNSIVFVGCEKECGFMTEGHKYPSLDFRKKKELENIVAKIWNTRPIEQALQAEIDRLKQALKFSNDVFYKINGLFLSNNKERESLARITFDKEIQSILGGE